MKLWETWMVAVFPMRTAFSRNKTFLWFIVILIGFTIRHDFLGVTSFVRALDLVPNMYPLLLHSFHSSGINLTQLRSLWFKHCLKLFQPFLVTLNGRLVFVADGTKNPKEGRKMPGVKSCHQESDNNSKPEYVMAHSCQALCLLVKGALSLFAVPLACEIVEGCKSTNRDNRTLFDRLISLVENLDVEVPYYVLADAYYAVQKIAQSLTKKGNHLLTRVRSNAVANELPKNNDPKEKKRRGRPKQYGERVRLSSFFKKKEKFTTIKSPFLNDEQNEIKIFSIDLLWRPVGQLVRFVCVLHPKKGRWILMCTDLTLSALEITKAYAMRSRIELCFKQAIYSIGAFGYHFWMRNMDRIKRFSGTQYLHRKSELYRREVKRKLRTYEVFMQYGLIAQGLMQYLAVKCPLEVFRNFRSWYRTLNTNKTPSEAVVGTAMRSSFHEFLLCSPIAETLRKFLADKVPWLTNLNKKMAG